MVAMQRPPGGAVGRAVPADSAHSGMPAVLTQGPDTATIGRAPYDGNFALLLEIASLPSSHRMKATAMSSPAVTVQPVDIQPDALSPTDQPRRLPDSKQVERIGRIVFLVVAAIIGTQVLKSALGLSLEDALPLLVLASIAFAVFRKRRGPPKT